MNISILPENILEGFGSLYIMLGGIIALAVFVNVIFPNLVHRWRIKKSLNAGNEWRNDQDLLHWLRGITPTEFEEYIAQLFRCLGYTSRAIGHSGDHGVDVEIEKDGVVSFVQCKKYSQSHKVGEPEVRNFLGALDHQHAKGKGYFVTTNIFTLAAEKFAEDKPIELIDGNKLIEYIRMSEKASQK